MTHYSFLSGLISDVVGNNIPLVETGAAVARQLQRRIQEELSARTVGGGSAEFFTTGDALDATRIMTGLWGKDVKVKKVALDKM